MMTSKYYAVIAASFNRTLKDFDADTKDPRVQGVMQAISFMCIDLEKDNPRFQMGRFINACWDGIG